MSRVFVGGSRQISRLPADATQRLANMVASEHQVLVGDANGVDKAVQKYLADTSYENVTVFCSGDSIRNNLGNWPTRHIEPPPGARGFQFYAAKDREMALEADFGLMIWDGKSPGTVLNVLRLVRAGKIAVLINVAEKSSRNMKSTKQWDAFLASCSAEFQRELQGRATAEEWAAPAAPLLAATQGDLALSINAALESGDPGAIVDAIGSLARLRGMTQVARDTGLARESLYRALSGDGNPEFATVLKVLSAMGLRLEAKPARAEADRAVRPA